MGKLSLVFFSLLIFTAWWAYPGLVASSSLSPVQAQFSHTAQTPAINIPGVGNVAAAVSINYVGTFTQDPPFLTRLNRDVSLTPTGVQQNLGTVSVLVNGKEVLAVPFDPSGGQYSILGGLARIRWETRPTISGTQITGGRLPGFLAFQTYSGTVNSEYRVSFFVDYGVPGLLSNTISLGSLKLFSQSSKVTVSFYPIEDIALILAAVTLVAAALGKFYGPIWDEWWYLRENRLVVS
jgi:hypothetical protein